MNKFWAVWKDTNNSTASKRHDTKQAAIDEAGRLIRSVGGSYFILEVVARVGTITPEIEVKDI